MAIISNGTTVASGGSVTVSSSAVASGIASISVGAVGSYAFMQSQNNSNFLTEGNTHAGSNLFYTNAHTYASNSASGTWRCMGTSLRSSDSTNYGARATLWLRIS
jgi:hypothetical protein